LFVAGADSSSTAVEWAMVELLRSLVVRKKVKWELKRVLGKKTHVEESHIGQLPHLQAVVKEVLRLHPPVVMTFYQAEATVSVLAMVLDGLIECSIHVMTYKFTCYHWSS
jgi:cytochrome P450